MVCLGQEIGGDCQVTADNLATRFRNKVTQLTNMNIILAWTEETMNLLTRTVNISQLSELREYISQLEIVQRDLTINKTGLDLLKDKVSK